MTMCLKSCSCSGLLAWLGGLLGAVIFVVVLNVGVDLVLSKPQAPVPAPAVVAAPPAPAVPAPEPAPAPAPAPEPVAAATPAPVPAAVVADPGAKIFAQCKACHSLEAGKNLVGPSLAGVVGRARASVAGFKYSDAMAASHEPWSEAALGKYLTDPKTAIPGNKMGFKGLASADDRAAVIAYLKSQGAK
jgi:cytochrome c2